MTLRSAFLYGSIGALVLGKSFSVVIQAQATRLPDPATGHTGPYLFASAISLHFNYITSWQGWLITAIYATAILCFVVWAALALRERFRRQG